MPKTRTIGNRIAPPRFLLFLGLLIGGWGAAIPFFGWQRGVMAGFDLAALGFLLSCISLINDEAEAMRTATRTNDANRTLLLAITVVLSLVILVAVGSQLSIGESLTAVDIGLIIVTMVLSWVFGNVIYTLHYAHLFYTRDDGGRDLSGLDFPNTKEPDYADFAYFAFTLGTALQTADVCITSRHIRRIVTMHSIAAFFFNLGVFALTINVLGSS